MFALSPIWILLLLTFHQVSSIIISKIKHVSISSRSPIYPSSNINCSDCLCTCLNPLLSSSCSGVNCFPSNHSCQLIEQQPWILESDTLINTTTNNFLIMKVNHSRLCSCYTPRKILDLYEQTNSSDYSTTTTSINSIKYIPNDDSLIVLNATLIRKLSGKNLSRILCSLSTSDYAISILHNDSRIYIAFSGNRSINMYDLNLTLLQNSISWSQQGGFFGGMFLWNNRILIVDITHSTIWSIESLNQSNLTKFFDFTSFSISSPISLFIYENTTLYISSRSRNLYVFNLNNFTLKQTIMLSMNMTMLFMRYDSNCHRLWFGTQNYTYAPVLDLQSNQMNMYPTTGIIARNGIYSIDFNVNYQAFYSDTSGYLGHLNIPDWNC